MSNAFKPTTVRSQNPQLSSEELFPKLESTAPKQTTSTSTKAATPAPFSYATMAKKLTEETASDEFIVVPTRSRKARSTSPKVQGKNGAVVAGTTSKVAAAADIPELLDDDASEYFEDYSATKSRAAHNRINKKTHKDY